MTYPCSIIYCYVYSSPQLVAFKANRYSVRHGDMANKINTEFRRLQEEKALLLHEELEHREK